MEEHNSNYDLMNRGIQQPPQNQPYVQPQMNRPPEPQQFRQPYRQPQVHQPYGHQYTKQASAYRGAAIASLITGICSIVFCWHIFFSWALALAGIITAVVYMSKRKDQRGMAIAGLVTSISGAVISVLFILVIMIFFTGMSSSSYPQPYNYYDDYYYDDYYYDDYNDEYYDYYNDNTL